MFFVLTVILLIILIVTSINSKLELTTYIILLVLNIALLFH